MKATTLNINNRYEVTGIEELSGGKYEMRYSHRFGGKSYKTEQNAIRAIEKAGYEFVRVERHNLVCAYD